MEYLTISVVVLYCASMFFFLYYCVMADPETSSVARFVGYTLPDKIWAFLGSIFGKKGIAVLEWVTDRALIILYIIVVFGSWSVIFAYVYPWIASQTYVSQIHRFVGVLVFTSCVVSWRYASTSSPGLITKQTLHLYDHYPYDGYMFSEGNICRTRNIPKLARSKFDRHKYGENVPRFDHFCGWLYNTIGECNYRWFLLFLLVHFLMCLYGAIIVGHLFVGKVLDMGLHTAVFFNRLKGEEKQGDFFIIFQYLFERHIVESAVLLLMAVMSVALAAFLGYHIWLTSRGLTTAESYKWSEVQQWYRKELQRYNDAVKTGQAVEEDQSNPIRNKPIISDKDVSCTSVSEPNHIDQQQQQQGEEVFDIHAIRHPGPEPVNVYNRGFWKNWEEVLFPLPLRKRKALAAERKNI